MATRGGGFFYFMLHASLSAVLFHLQDSGMSQANIDSYAWYCTGDS